MADLLTPWERTFARAMGVLRRAGFSREAAVAGAAAVADTEVNDAP